MSTTHGKLLLVAALGVFAACGQPEQAPRAPTSNTSADSQAALLAIQAGQFGNAMLHAERVLASDPRDSRAAAIRAVARYQTAGEALVRDLGAILDRGESVKHLDHDQGRKVWQTFLAALEPIDRDLALVAGDPQFALELCLACWAYDWNHNGQVDDRDNRLFELEFDGKGGTLAEGDPRRRPTFRFDVGDALWARAMLAFQRAGVELVLAYQWSELDKLFGSSDDVLTIHLIDADRVRRARELVIMGLGFADQTRVAYLAESDDDREWVPNPRQKSYAMPLVVDDSLYATWGAVTRDVHRLLASKEGIDLRDAATVLVGSWAAKQVPAIYVDIGRMFREPKDIVIDFRNGTRTEHAWRGLLGAGYTETMRASPLVGRLRHMKDELERGEDSFERKLRYLFWLN